MNKRSSNLISPSILIYGIAIIIAIGVTIASCSHTISKTVNRREVIGTVTDKGIKRYNKDDKYMIYTKDEDGNPQVYEITDSLLSLRFNSSDVYTSIEIGKTYKFTVGGNRNRFLSYYPNIYEFEEIK